MESITHRQLKSACLRLLVQAGCAAGSTEVRCPLARARVDVAGYWDAKPRPGKARSHENPVRAGEPELISRGDHPQTVVIECKQSREDFLRDCDDRARLMTTRTELERARERIEVSILRVCEPHLRVSGSSLFVELESWDFARSSLPSYREVVRELAKLERRLHGSTKFWRFRHYRLADRLFIAAPRGMIREHELPGGWGLLEIARSEVESDVECAWEITKAAPEMDARSVYRQRLLRNIAASLTRQAIGRSSAKPTIEG